MKRTALKRKSRLSPISKRRKEEMKEYSRLRKEFLSAHPVCYVWWDKNNMHVTYEKTCNAFRESPQGWPQAAIATDVHHVKKRGKHYLDVSSWMAVSRTAHQWIHDNPKLAREQGFLV
jgi:hypothetical protein